jgi:Transposase
VAVEQSRGALVFMLSKYELFHLFPVPGQMAGSMRQALYPSGAKDDPRDADLLLDLLLQHRSKLRRLSPDSEATRCRTWWRNGASWWMKFASQTNSGESGSA